MMKRMFGWPAPRGAVAAPTGTVTGSWRHNRLRRTIRSGAETRGRVGAGEGMGKENVFRSAQGGVTHGSPFTKSSAIPFGVGPAKRAVYAPYVAREGCAPVSFAAMPVGPQRNSRAEDELPARQPRRSACGMKSRLAGKWPGCGMALGAALLAAHAGGADSGATEQYHIYSGSTHAHTQFTWSHGEQWAGGDGGESKQPMRHTPEGVQLPPANAKTKEKWEQFQGPPAAHFA